MSYKLAPTDGDATVVYWVYNAMGAEIYSTESKSAIKIEKIHIPGLATGMYVLNMDIDNGLRDFKVFKH